MSLPTSTASILSPTLALPPSDSELGLGSKRSRNASKLGDGITAHLVSSAEELEKAKEARKQKAAQRALKRGGMCLTQDASQNGMLRTSPLSNFVSNIWIFLAQKKVE